MTNIKAVPTQRMVTKGEIFHLTSMGLKLLASLSDQNTCILNNPKYNTEILSNGNLKLTPVISGDSEQRKYNDTVDTIRKTIIQRKWDIENLERDIKELIRQSNSSDPLAKNFTEELGQKTLLIYNHRHELSKIRSKKEIELAFSISCFVLQPLIPMELPNEIDDIMWCPIKTTKKAKIG